MIVCVHWNCQSARLYGSSANVPVLSAWAYRLFHNSIRALQSSQIVRLKAYSGGHQLASVANFRLPFLPARNLIATLHGPCRAAYGSLARASRSACCSIRLCRFDWIL